MRPQALHGKASLCFDGLTKGIQMLQASGQDSHHPVLLEDSASHDEAAGAPEGGGEGGAPEGGDEGGGEGGAPALNAAQIAARMAALGLTWENQNLEDMLMGEEDCDVEGVRDLLDDMRADHMLLLLPNLRWEFKRSDYGTRALFFTSMAPDADE